MAYKYDENGKRVEIITEDILNEAVKTEFHSKNQELFLKMYLKLTPKFFDTMIETIWPDGSSYNFSQVKGVDGLTSYFTNTLEFKITVLRSNGEYVYFTVLYKQTEKNIAFSVKTEKRTISGDLNNIFFLGSHSKVERPKEIERTSPQKGDRIFSKNDKEFYGEVISTAGSKAKVSMSMPSGDKKEFNIPVKDFNNFNSGTWSFENWYFK